MTKPLCDAHTRLAELGYPNPILSDNILRQGRPPPSTHTDIHPNKTWRRILDHPNTDLDQWSLHVQRLYGRHPRVHTSPQDLGPDLCRWTMRQPDCIDPGKLIGEHSFRCSDIFSAHLGYITSTRRPRPESWACCRFLHWHTVRKTAHARVNQRCR